MIDNSTIKSGDKVCMIENGRLEQGIVKDMAGAIRPIAIVDFNGVLKKVLICDLAKIEDNDDRVEEKKNELTEKAEITITPGEFKKIASELIFKEVQKIGNDSQLIEMAFIVFTVELHRALFYEDTDID